MFLVFSDNNLYLQTYAEEKKTSSIEICEKSCISVVCENGIPDNQLQFLKHLLSSLRALDTIRYS